MNSDDAIKLPFLPLLKMMSHQVNADLNLSRRFSLEYSADLQLKSQFQIFLHQNWPTEFYVDPVDCEQNNV